MTTIAAAALMLLANPELRGTAERAAAAAGIRSVSADSGELTRRTWLAAAVVVIDEASARLCELQELPRRDGVVLLTVGVPVPSLWESAIAVGAQHIWSIPEQEGELVRRLSEAVEAARGGPNSGRVIAVTAGRGGAGSSIFSAALAQAASEALLVDLDPWSGGIDLLPGGESTPGLRWPDLSVRGGRLSWNAVRDALPQHSGVSVLSCTRSSFEMDPAPAESIVEAGRRGGATVICDVPRRMTDTAACVLDCADLVVAITTCDVRGVAAMSALTPVLRSVNPHVGLVVRGPSPGGLQAGDIADAIGLPLLAAMRPQPLLAEQLERGGLRLRRRSPLAAAARRVLGVLERRVQVVAA